jgi:type II secretory pathway pseudopilin PulG
LIELMVALTILSFLFLLAVPTYQRIQRKAKSAAIVNDLRVFATAFQAHAHDAGSFPPESAPGEVPVGMTPEEIKYDDWRHMTPIGGNFDWENNQTHGGVKYQAAITIVPTADAPFTSDDELFLDIDRAIDDGDPDTGNFRRGFGGYPLFIIEN